MYRHYGDTAVLKTHWASLNAFMGYIERTSDKTTGLNLLGGLSDWVPPGGNGRVPTPGPECSAFYALLDTRHMAVMATAIGETVDSERYTAAFTAGQKAYHAHFYNTTTGVYSKGTQCSAMMALFIGAVPVAIGETVILLTLSLSIAIEAPTKGRGGCSRMTLSPTARCRSRSKQPCSAT